MPVFPSPTLPLILPASCWAGPWELSFQSLSFQSLSFQSLCQVPCPGLPPLHGVSGFPPMWGSGGGPPSLIKFSLEVKEGGHHLGQHSATKGWSS